MPPDELEVGFRGEVGVADGAVVDEPGGEAGGEVVTSFLEGEVGVG